VQELVAKVLPHPLVKVMDEIHVSWQGPEKPAPCDLAALLSVRRRVVERALMWLKDNNHLYVDISIDKAELESWEAAAHGVPSQIYERLERNEPSAREKTQTAHIVPPTERGLDEPGPVDIQEILESLGENLGGSGGAGENGVARVEEEAGSTSLSRDRSRSDTFLMAGTEARRRASLALPLTWIFRMMRPTVWKVDVRVRSHRVLSGHEEGRGVDHLAEHRVVLGVPAGENGKHRGAALPGVVASGLGG
jgi:hypothetical protein